MPNNSPNRKHLRPEAGVVKWHQLDTHQQQAFIRILEMLVEAVDGLPPLNQQDRRTTETLYPWFDFHRENRVALLQGARGTGKTSVMLSLIDTCMQKKVEEANKAIEPKLGRLRCRTIWLEPLDMEPLPGPTNLLAAILARIGEAIKYYIPQSTTEDGRRGPRGILELCPGYLDVLEDLQRLQADAALAWDGNIAERGGHLDPDSYAMEVIRAERARLSLNRNLSNTLNNLAENISSACGVTNPIFVLTVDDLDLNPTRCLEILRLLRMINVPRLFILVLGDLDMIGMVLELKHTGDFMKVAGDPGSPCPDLYDLTRISMKTHILTYNTMRKLLPPEQQIHIGSMQIWEALNYRPPEPNSENMLKLHALLATWPVEFNSIIQEKGPFMSDGNKITSLWDFLMFPVPHTFKNNEIEESNIKKSCYKARQVLRMPPRHIADWWSFLQKIDEPSFDELVNEEDKLKKEEIKRKIKEKWRVKRFKELIDGVGFLCQSAIREESSLSLEDRNNYYDALRKNRLTGEWELFLNITTIPETGPVKEIPIQEKEKSPLRQILYLRSCKGWKLYPVDSKLVDPFEYARIVSTVEFNKELNRLHQRPAFMAESTRALIFLHDLQELGPQQNLTPKRIFLSPPILYWAYTRLISGSSDFLIFWPVPNFLSFWGYDIFLSYWNNAINGLQNIKENDQSIYLVYSWIDSALAVVRKPPNSSPNEEKTSSLKYRAIKNWEELANEIERLIPTLTDKDDFVGALVYEWLRRLANFLMPEISGIDIKYVKPFGKHPKLNKYWSKCWSDDIKQFRDEIFDQFKKNKEEEDEDWIKILKIKGNQDYAKAMGIEDQDTQSESHEQPPT